MNKELFEALDILERERHIPKAYMIEKIEAALTAACKKELGTTNITVVLSPKDKSELASYRKALIDEEKRLLVVHLNEMKLLLESHQQATRKYLKSESGFYLTGWISKYSVIAFWVLYAYFCLTIGSWLLLK